MYPDFLAAPELTLSCLRQEADLHLRQSEHCRLALQGMTSRPVGLSLLYRVANTRIARYCLWLKPKPKLASMTVASR